MVVAVMLLLGGEAFKMTILSLGGGRLGLPVWRLV